MMYFLLILFFGSLFSITFMIGRKLVFLGHGQISYKKETILETPLLEEFKALAVKNVKKHGYVVLVATIRFYVRSSNTLKNKYKELGIKIKNLRNKSSDINSFEKREVSKFLTMISEYKQKIRTIKEKIAEEETK